MRSWFTKKADKRIAAYQNELVQTHYAEVEVMYKQMRGWRHDYRNHIQVMKSYVADGDMEAVQHYLDLLDTDLRKVDRTVKTGNKMADAILNSKISLAQSKEIKVKADVHIPVALTIGEMDVCVLLGNLFDNAIEATLPLPVEERLIRVYIDDPDTYMYFRKLNKMIISALGGWGLLYIIMKTL